MWAVSNFAIVFQLKSLQYTSLLSPRYRSHFFDFAVIDHQHSTE